MYHLPYNTHRWLLCPLINQSHISIQLYKRDIKCMYNMLNCPNDIVKQCMYNARNNSNTLIGYKIAFMRSRYGFSVFDANMNNCIHQMKPSLTIEQQSQVDCLHTLCLAKSNHITIGGFTHEEINCMIEFIASS